ncbi:RNA-binding cell elongation regulator Jag/EloR [Vagococcus intermedius]|uniref:RNA-binding protein KhpB n=1 Tax=Vagococcus intermedius TaxID=2991418 RepID=A0AAF0CUR4_9ENTE|nr:RNA-binding cell elongation regulator Jag/EloR [Vagococcus intermedius]WEG73329.1 protein jag [Vagococcus intermedius]WEG75409.1 protein jag [Vagococcus intermedius]
MPKYEGLTVDEAIQKGLSHLMLSENQVEITIISEEKKGFLGFGKKEASVNISPLEENNMTSEVTRDQEITQKPLLEKEKNEQGSGELVAVGAIDEQAIRQLETYLTTITKEMGVPAVVTFDRIGNSITYKLESDKPGMLIGKHGKLLNAIQYLAQVYIHRMAESKLTVIINVGDYRERRESALQRLAFDTAKTVKKTKRPVFLDPMPSFERKKIHAILAKDKAIKTHSEGDEPFRYLVVEYVKIL